MLPRRLTSLNSRRRPNLRTFAGTVPVNVRKNEHATADAATEELLHSGVVWLSGLSVVVCVANHCDRAVGRQGSHHPDGCSKRGNDGADDSDGERDVEQRPIVAIFDGEATNAAFTNPLSDLVQQLFAFDLKFFRLGHQYSSVGPLSFAHQSAPRQLASGRRSRRPMPATIPNDVRALLTEPIFFHLATINPDGSPQVSVVWADLDGDLIRFSTAEGRAKPRNLRRDPRVSISFLAPDDSYRNIVITGRAVEIEQRGMDLIDHMARKYVGVDKYQWSQPGEVRVDVAIEVDKVTG